MISQATQRCGVTVPLFHPSLLIGFSPLILQSSVQTIHVSGEWKEQLTGTQEVCVLILFLCLTSSKCGFGHDTSLELSF